MKKSILIFLISSFALKINSQTANPTVDFSEDGGSYYSNINQKGQIFINPYFGFPNILSGGIDVNNGLTFPIKSNETIDNVGPLGLNLSFMVSDDVSAGLDVNYSKCSKTFEYIGYDSLNTETFNGSRTIIRAMVSVNYHMHINDRVEGYLGIGAGYRDPENNFSSTDSNYVDLSPINENNFAFRISGGLNIFINKQIGINTEFGLGGGGLIRLGLFYKLI